MTFASILSTFSTKPKTLDAAATTIESTKPTLDSVAALFSAAGLNVDTMLAAGPDALKAHLASLSANDALLATAQAKVTELTNTISTNTAAHATALAAETTKLATATTALTSAHELLTTIGLDPKATLEPAAAKTAFAAHVMKAANTELAKSGHPPIRELPGAAAAGAKVMGFAAFQALSHAERANFMRAGGQLTT